MLCYYKNSTPRRYGAKRKSIEDAPDGEQNYEQGDGGDSEQNHCEQGDGGDSEPNSEQRNGGDEHVFQYSSGILSWGQPCFNANDGGLLYELRSNENSRDSLNFVEWYREKALFSYNVAGTEPCLVLEYQASAGRMLISSLIEGERC